ncbi:FlmA family RiPP peptide [Pedobacter yulinensis]|uniref:hypothetical protein n=1 Tax=Pedobacter yulinensis TaxID=2126353 RepID=UPI0013A5FA0D|nr:hypothetical protein [Pedobacter yulinensis]
MTKEELKNSLLGKELVKPNLSETRLSEEVDSLCSGFSCGTNTARGSGDVLEEDDILF